MNRHISVHHSGAPSQKCMHCDKSFYHRAGLLSHIRTVHQMDKSFYCSKCSRAFSSGTTSSSFSCLMPKICPPKKIISDYFLSRWLIENDSFFRLQASDAHRHLPPKHEAFPVHALQLILPKVFKLVLPYRHQVLFIVKLFFASVCVTSGRQL